MEPVRGLPYGPAACITPHSEAGHMSALDYAPQPTEKSACSRRGVHTCQEFRAVVGHDGRKGTRPCRDAKNLRFLT